MPYRERRHALLTADAFISLPAELNFLCGNLAHSPRHLPGPQPSGRESWDPGVHAQPTADI